MDYKEATLMIVTSFLIHIYFTFDVKPYFLSNDGILSDQTAGKVSIGVALLLFPLFGIVADVWLTRYKMIQTSLIVLTSILAIALIILQCYYIVFQGITNMNFVTGKSIAGGMFLSF